MEAVVVAVGGMVGDKWFHYVSSTCHRGTFIPGQSIKLRVDLWYAYHQTMNFCSSRSGIRFPIPIPGLSSTKVKFYSLNYLADKKVLSWEMSSKKGMMGVSLADSIRNHSVAFGGLP